MAKRIISIILACLMFSSLFILPVCAETNPFDKTGNIPQDMINAAMAQRGKKNSDFHYDGMPADQWCAYFIVWLSRVSGAGDAGIFPKLYSQGGTTRAIAGYAAKRGSGTLVCFHQASYDYMTTQENTPAIMGNAYSFEPQPGDLIFFRWSGKTTKFAHHVGLVYAVDGNNVYYIDGNGSYSGSNFHYSISYVDTHTISKYSSEIAAYLRPVYNGDVPNAPTTTITECKYRVTVPANYRLQCYQYPESTTKYRYISALSYPYTLTCTKKVDRISGGVRYYFVSSDGYELYFDYDAGMEVSISHNYTSWSTTPATCLTSGYTTYYCTCGHSYDSDFVDVLEHIWNEGSIIKEPTEAEEGIKIITCTVCGETNEVLIEKLEHVHSFQTTVCPATCTEAGYTLHLCACGETYTDNVTETAPHSWNAGTITTAPTEETEGTKTYTCTACNHTKTESVPKLEHTHKYDPQIVSPTCTEAGYTLHLCACGERYATDPTQPIGHRWDSGRVTVEPTEEKPGTTTYTCIGCGQAKTESIPVLPHSHSYKDTVTLPTCTQGGYTTYTCKCGDSFITHETNPLEHVYTNGFCTACGAKEDTGMTGDVDGNGILNYMDALLVLRHSIGLITLDTEVAARGDVDKNGALTYMDALKILRFSIGLIDKI